MMASMQISLLAIIFASFLYWSLPSNSVKLRSSVLIGTSAFLLFVFNPYSLALVILITLFAGFVYRLCRRFPSYGWLAWLIALPLIVDNLFPIWQLIGFPDMAPRNPMLVHAQNLGISFYTFKLYISIKEALKYSDFSYRGMFATTLFFPAFSMGPIDSARAFSSEVMARNFDYSIYLQGIMRIGVGIAKVFVLSVLIQEDLSSYVLSEPLNEIDTGFWKNASIPSAFAYSYVSFLNLYVNFSGFTDIALGSALLFNINLTENFKFPLLSRSIQNFWQRWHLSLSKFITKYIFKPLLRFTGRPSLSIIVTFILVGLWHKLSVGYLIWGMGHGIALALYAKYASKRGNKADANFSLQMISSIVLTITFVSLLSVIANQSGTDEILAFLGALTGTGGLFS